MKTYRSAWMGLVAGGVLAFALTAFAGSGSTRATGKRSTGLVEVVEQAAGQFRDPNAAEQPDTSQSTDASADRRRARWGCISSRASWSATASSIRRSPRRLIYEPRNRHLELVGVEYPGPRRGLARAERGAAGLDGAADALRCQPESLWPASILRAARLALDGRTRAARLRIGIPGCRARSTRRTSRRRRLLRGTATASCRDNRGHGFANFPGWRMP